MQTKVVLALTLSLVITITGCAKRYFPDTLKGSFNNGIYTSRIGSPSYNRPLFSVLIPQSYDENAAHFMVTREQFQNDYTFVSLGPIAESETTYRIFVVDKGRMPLALFKELYFPKLINLSVKGYDRQMYKIHEQNVMLDRYPGVFEVYIQQIPANFSYYSTRQTGDITLTHAIYFINHGCFGVILWIQASTDSGMWPINKWNRGELINQTWKPLVRFARSFYINYDASTACERMYRPPAWRRFLNFW